MTDANAGAMEVELVAIGELMLDDKNARKGNVEELMGSLAEFGQHRAVVVQRGTNKVLIGNHMVMAATALGWSDISVTWVDDDDETALRRSLSDNMVGDAAKWDDVQLKSLLEEASEPVTIPGMNDKTLERLLAEETPEEVAQVEVLPIQAKPNEGYSYVMVIADNEIDILWLEEQFQLPKAQSYKSQKVGTSRVITVDQLREGINRAVKRGVEY